MDWVETLEKWYYFELLERMSIYTKYIIENPQNLGFENNNYEKQINNYRERIEEYQLQSTSRTLDHLYMEALVPCQRPIHWRRCKTILKTPSNNLSFWESWSLTKLLLLKCLLDGYGVSDHVFIASYWSTWWCFANIFTSTILHFRGNPQRIDTASSNKRITFTYEQVLRYIFYFSY